jgi:hypothetical protein
MDGCQQGVCILLAVLMLCCDVLCCAVLCCAVLCCAVLCCAVLCCAVLCCGHHLAGVLSCFRRSSHGWLPTGSQHMTRWAARLTTGVYDM